MKAMISGWKDGHDVNPITLLGLLRGALELDLPAAKALLDRFAEDGRLQVTADPERLQRLQDDASAQGIAVKIESDQ